MALDDSRRANREEQFEIEQVLLTYGEALDKRRWDLLEEIFSPDLTAHWQFGAAEQSGRADVIAHIRRRIETFKATHHLFANFRVRVAGNGQSATAEFRARNYHAGAGEHDDAFMETLATFQAELVLSGVSWRITTWRLLDHDRIFGSRGSESMFYAG